ncbi:MAG: hypothetical protein HYR72_24435 [Deltaproteobacteria bacterium]|nr:hypothetical protein [Deltaproteobacteria bacterium]MBI3389251.1 hypothetical protein [Deltaproteobacteria bacterium]
MTNVTGYVLTMTLATLVGSQVVWAEESGEKEHAELAKALGSAKVSLGAGLTASASEGKPISAKFEVEDGKLQLSVYAEKDGKFSEVVVDQQSGKVAKSEAITEGDDLAAAKSQSAAMAKAKASLTEAVAKAVAEHSGYRAVSVAPSLKNGHPIAEVELVKGKAWKTLRERLD